MKKLILAVIVALVVAAVAAALNAADSNKPKDVTLTGTLICMGCELKTQYGAKAQCNVYGHDHALKAADGKIYTFLPNDNSKDLIAGKADKSAKITVTGTLFPGSQIVDVKDVKGLSSATAAVYKCTHCGATYDKAGDCCGVPTVAAKL
ncbi:MAG: hypothetical protein HYX78_14810 [Armatimonadetes bacterium]|nr:hypothetical protein [Armatimonadota bacterium]